MLQTIYDYKDNTSVCTVQVILKLFLNLEHLTISKHAVSSQVERSSV